MLTRKNRRGEDDDELYYLQGGEMSLPLTTKMNNRYTKSEYTHPESSSTRRREVVVVYGLLQKAVNQCRTT